MDSLDSLYFFQLVSGGHYACVCFRLLDGVKINVSCLITVEQKNVVNVATG